MTAPENSNRLPDQAALQKALRYIRHSPRSRGETTERLRRWGYSDRTVNEVADYLERTGILDDQSLAAAYFDEMLRKGFGYRRVRASLIKKKLENHLIEELLGDYPMDKELERATQLACGRMSGPESLEGEGGRGKITGFLMRSGYSRQVSTEAWRALVQFDTQNRRE